MLHLKLPLIVEGRYDKSHLSSVVSANIITTDGFRIFKNPEKRALIRKLGANGIIILCDSDGGGNVIRSHLKGQLGGIKIYDLYIPQIEGKERRKSAPSKAGYLGVEGVPADILRKVFEDFAAAHPEAVEESGNSAKKSPISRSLMFELGLSGGANAQENRDRICVKLGLPRGMSANAMFSAVNMISGEEEITRLANEKDS